MILENRPANETIELSQREKEILRLVATGASNKEIAQQLFISANTVKVHLRNVFAKIGAVSRTEAAMYAVKTGLVTTVTPFVGDGDISFDQKDELTSGQEAGQNEVLSEGLETSRGGRFPIKKVWVTMVAGGIILGIMAVVLRMALSKQGGFLAAPVSTPTIQTMQRWTRLADMPTARSGLAAAMVENKIYAIGGTTAEGVTGVVESYDLQKGTWEPRTSKPHAVTDVQAGVIGGKIYVPGGRSASGEISQELEVYDPVTNHWEEGPPLPVPICGYALVSFEGKLYLFGGWDGQRYLDSVYMLTPGDRPGDNVWTLLTRMPAPRAWAGAAVANAQIHLMGGFDGVNVLATHEIFQPHVNAGQSWTKGAVLPQSRSGLSIIAIADSIFVFGGTDAEARFLFPLQLAPQNVRWQEMHQWGLDGFSKAGIAQWGGYVYIVGGTDGTNLLDQLSVGQVIYTILLPAVP